MPENPSDIADKIVHAGRPDRNAGRNINLPIETGSTMAFDTMAEFEAALAARHQSGTFYYGRYGTRASFGLEDALRELEGAADVTLTSSGVSAITSALVALVEPGDHLLVADNVYGNSRAFCEGLLRRQGVDVEFFDPMIGAGIGDLFHPATRAVMFEAPGSGTFEMPDIPAIARASRQAGVLTVLDNTWATPIFCRPLGLGVDVVVASGSKYLGGHSDCMIGWIAAASDEIGQAIRQTVHALGDKPGGQEVFLALRGLRTLRLRMARVDEAGREMAAWLATQPQTRRVLHPAFGDCPGHANWARDFSGAAGLFGVVLHPCGAEAVHRFVDALEQFSIGVSWGGYESLVLPVKPRRTATEWTEPGQLIRFSIGLEDPASLKADLAAALPLLENC